jgi:protein-tyrosine-phosphatase
VRRLKSVVDLAFDFVYCMDRRELEKATAILQRRARILLLGSKGIDLPSGAELSAFERTAEAIEQALGPVLQEITSRIPSQNLEEGSVAVLSELP